MDSHTHTHSLPVPRTPTADGIDLDTHIVMADNRDWIRHQITVRIPGDANIVGFGIFLVGPGRIELRDAELTRPTA